jgi:cyclopropane-fatty-acyl-phospholipid synthase
MCNKLNNERNYWYRIVHKILQKADIEINGSRPWGILVNHLDFSKRILQKGSMRQGESYMNSWWDCERVDMFFHRSLTHKLDEQLPHQVQDMVSIALARLVNLRSKKRAWQVGKAHYNLGNDLFTLILDPCRQYSCGYWKDATTLEAAQEAKMDMICRKLESSPV